MVNESSTTPAKKGVASWVVALWITAAVIGTIAYILVKAVSERGASLQAPATTNSVPASK
jgi:hypothetical protein